MFPSRTLGRCPDSITTVYFEDSGKYGIHLAPEASPVSENCFMPKVAQILIFITYCRVSFAHRSRSFSKFP